MEQPAVSKYEYVPMPADLEELQLLGQAMLAS
jgi:hypothetical protein